MSFRLSRTWFQADVTSTRYFRSICFPVARTSKMWKYSSVITKNVVSPPRTGNMAIRDFPLKILIGLSTAKCFPPRKAVTCFMPEYNMTYSTGWILLDVCAWIRLTLPKNVNFMLLHSSFIQVLPRVVTRIKRSSTLKPMLTWWLILTNGSVQTFHWRPTWAVALKIIIHVVLM